MTEIVVIAHNIRSTHNVGSFFRSCEGFGVRHLYLTGYTPYPALPNDTRLPHLRAKLTAQIHKTALGAEALLPFSYSPEPLAVLQELRAQGYQLVALEQTPHSVLLPNLAASPRVALLLGEEVHGVTPELLAACDVAVEIPMHGQKESFNVSVALGIALYEIAF